MWKDLVSTFFRFGGIFMTTNFAIQGLQDLLTFPLRTPDAKKKLLIAGLLGIASFIIPILPALFLLGYAGLIMQQMIREKSEPFLPEWNDWDKMLKLGTKLFGASLIYSLPVGLIFSLGYLGSLVPLILSMINDPHSNHAMNQIFGLELVGTFGFMVCFGVGLALTLGLVAVLPVIMAHVAATNSFSAAFHVKDWWKILKTNIGGFAVTIILLGGIYMILVLVLEILYMTLILCIVIPFISAFISAYLLIIADVLFAQAYRDAQEKLAAQIS
jgi:hypothetical protein